MDIPAYESLNERLVVLCPPTLVEMVERAARSKLSNRSQYTRAAIMRQLEADGFKPEAA